MFRFVKYALAFILLAMPAFAMMPGQHGRPDFMCRSSEAAMRMGLAIDLNQNPIEVGTALLRGGECVAFVFRPPEVEFLEATDAQEHTQVWRVLWGQEDWFVPLSWGGKEA